MARTPHTHLIQQALTAIRRAKLSGRSPEEEWAQHRIARREMLVALASAGAVGCVPVAKDDTADTWSPPPVPSTFTTVTTTSTTATTTISSVDVAIIGAGLAGLNCCHKLAQGGVVAQVYEASDRVGGRILTTQNPYGEGLSMELGASLINDADTELKALASEFGLTLTNLFDDDYPRLDGWFNFNGNVRRPWTSYLELTGLVGTFISQVGGFPSWDTLSYNNAPAAAVALDQISVAQWLSDNGYTGSDADWVNVVCQTDYGQDPDQISALNLMALFGVGSSLEFNEQYKIQGGNEQIVAALAAPYGDRIHLDHWLEAVIERDDGRYTLVFANGTEVIASTVVLTLPFTVLRDIDLQVALPPEKLDAIARLSYGHNNKLIVPCTQRFWRADDGDGYTLTDTGYQSTWDASQLQPGTFGLLTNFRGGASALGLGTADLEVSRSNLFGQLELIFPGCTQFSDPRAPSTHYWPGIDTARGSYSSYGLNQWTAFGSAEASTVGQLYFAGEHTSRQFRGYMNGAAQSGADTAAAILSAP